MAVISVPSSIQGNSYSVRIAGDTPTPEEQARIDAYVAQMDARLAPATPAPSAAPEEESSVVGDFGSGLGRGFFGSLASIPSGLGALAEAGYGALVDDSVTIGSTGFGRVMSDISDFAQSGVEGAFGPSTDTTSGKIGEAIGSIGSFLVPAGVAGGGARLLGATAKTAGRLGVAAGTTMGTALGADQQAQDIGDAILNGDIVDPDAQQAAVLWGGLIGASEMVAGGAVSKLVGTTFKILNKVPPSMREEAIATFGGRIRSALMTGGIEGAQEALSQIAQNIVSREYYDEGRDIYEGAGEQFGVGGVAGAAIDLALSSARAPAVRRQIQQRQAKEDQDIADEIAADQADDAQDIIAKIGLGQKSMQPEVEAEVEVDQPVAGLLPPPAIGTQATQEAPAGGAAVQAGITPPKVEEAAPAASPARPAPSFRWKQYQATLQEIAKTKAVTIPAIQKAAATAGSGPVTPAVAKDIRAQMEADGVVRQDKKAKGGYAYQPNVAPKVDNAESYRRTLEDIAREAEDARNARERALQEARRAQQTGKPADYRKQMLEVDKAEQAIQTAERTAAEIQARIPTAVRQAAVPTVEQPRSPIADGKAAVPITDAPPAIQSRAVTDRTQRLRQALSHYQGQVQRQTSQLRRLKADQKKVQLPKSEIKRMGELEKSISEASYYVQEISKRLARPAADIEENAAQAKAAAAKDASVKAERAARTPAYTAREGEVFAALRKRLDNLGLSDVRLVAEKLLKPDLAKQGALVEGIFDVKDGNRMIAVSMGIYDPNMSNQEMFDAVSGVVNHEVIHAMRNLGLFTDAEWKILSDLAARQRYMRQKDGKVTERKYTYLQRAKQMYADQTVEIQIEEAVAEMFRDYVAGRLKIGGRPKTLMERIKGFFQSIWKAHEDVGFTDANQIFEGVRFGEVGKRARKPVDGDVAMQSRAALPPLPEGVATEEEVYDPKDIVMPINASLPPDQVRAQIRALTQENVALVKDLIKRIDAKYGTKSGDNVKDLSKVTQKARRPSILHKKPWHTVAHIRDSYRFKTVINDFRDVPAIFQELLDSGIQLVKIDTNKLFNPQQWGWRIIAFDLRMPNGQLVEWYLPIRELEQQKKDAGHLIFEEWRNKTQAELLAQHDEYMAAIRRSFEGYDEAFQKALDRIGVSRQEAEASWSNAESSLLEAARNSRKSSGVMTSSSDSGRAFQTPSSVRMAVEPSSRNSMAREEPSSTRANVLGMGGTSNESVSQGSVQDNLTPEQLDQVRYSIAMVVRKPERGMERLLPAPVKSREGTMNSHYGTIFEGSRPIAVVFPEGSQNDDAKAGVGMAHIVARGHDKELFDNSKYKSVQQAVYDIMYRWARQGHQDGEEIVSRQYDGNLTLEWVGNRTHGAPPLRLVLARYDAKGYPIYAVKTFFPVLERQKQSPTRFSMLTVPEGTRAHKLPDILLEQGDGQPPIHPITQEYLPSNVARNNAAIEAALRSNPNHLRGEGNWLKLMQETFGGQYLPKAPFVAMDYALNPTSIAQKLEGLTPALKDGVDRGFKHVSALRDLYRSGQATPDMTADLFIWGILSRGAGPVQQEGAYIDVIDSARPFVEKAIAGPLSDSDLDLWKVQVTGALREGSPGRQVTMNVNAAGRLLQAMSQMAPNSDKTVLQTVHDMMSDPSVSGPEIRRWFLSNTESAGIDNKVVSFILLVGGRNDVLVMDRIQSRHLWDDGRFGGMNIYDGIGKDKGGLSQIMKGPRGLLITEALERGLRDSVMEAYQIAGRPEDASLGRFHWESWVIEGEQVVDHSTLAAVASRSPVGFSVTEGKMATFSSGSRYIRTKDGSIMEYPLSNGEVVYMKPTTFKDFLEVVREPKNAVVPKKFKITDRADIPWYERPDVDRRALDQLARSMQDAKSEGEVYGRNARTGEGTAADGSGQTRFSRAVVGGRAGDGSRRETVRGLAPLEGAPQVKGASGPDMRLVRVAEDYARSIGIDLRRQAYYAKVDPERAARIAAAYDAMEHAPKDPKVKAAYDDLIRQTVAQYRALEKAGYKFWFMDPDNLGEYADSPWNAMRDLRANQSMGVFPTTGGFGTNEEADISGNPLLAETGIMWPFGSPDGTPVPVLANDLFRAVHDAFGHGLEGAGFRADGEENAWQAHIRLFTGPARGAITSETRGQNSWLNYGPYGEKNRNAKVEDTVFADQKTGLMPEWTWEEGRVPDAEAYPDERMSIRYSASAITPQVQKKVQSNQKGLMYARSADLIAKVLNLKGYGLEERTARDFADGVLRRFQDSMLPVGRMIQELSAKGLTITDAMDTYLQEELMHGVVGQKIAQNQQTLYEPILNAVKRLNVPQAKIDQLVKISDANSKSGRGYVGLALQEAGSPRLALAEAYLYAKHARERNRYIKANRDETNDAGSGMTDAEANAIIQWFDGLDNANKQVMQDMVRGVRAVVANTNQTRLDAGLITDEVVDAEEGTTVAGSDYKFYVPLRGKIGEEADDEFRGPPSSPRFGARGREDRKALGRFDYGTDILANLFAQNQNAILRGERNKVGQSFLKLLRANPSVTSEYAQILAKQPTMRASVDGKIREVPDPRAADEPDILVVKENGKQVFVRFTDERLAGALNGKNGVSPANGSALLRAMQTVNRYLASINTSYNPEFFITNMFRDLQTAGVNVNQYEIEGITKTVMGGIRPALAGIKRVIRNNDDSSEWAKIYKDFVAAGGQNATNQFNSLAEEMDNIQTMLGDISDAGARGQWNRVKNGFVGKNARSLLQFVEDYNTVIENGVRVATYKALLDKGFTRQRAAQAARNVTVNFAKGGDYRQFMNAWYLFYNASLQGSFALLNAAVRSPKVRKLWLGVIAAGAVQDFLNAMLSEEDDDGTLIYDKIPDYVLERNFILPDPFGLTERSYISIPMPYGLNMAHNIGRASSRALRGGYDGGEATTTILGTIADTLNPIGGAESWANLVAPTVADPFIDIIENEDFANKPIFKEGLPFDRTPAPDSQQYWSTTSPSAKWVASMLNDLTGGNEVRSGFIDWSPDVLEYWFDFATGGVGRFVQRSLEAPANMYEAGWSEELIRQVPFVRKTIGSVSDREDMGEYIEGAKRVLMAADELKRAREVGDAEWARQTQRDYAQELRLVGPIKSMESALRRISAAKNKVEDNPNMPESQKRLLLERFEAQRQAVLSRATALLNQLD